MEIFTITPEQARTILNVSKQRLSQLRQEVNFLVKGEDYDKIKNKYHFSQAGIDKIKERQEKNIRNFPVKASA